MNLLRSKLEPAGEWGSGAHDQSADHLAELVPLWSERKFSQQKSEEHMYHFYH